MIFGLKKASCCQLSTHCFFVFLPLVSLSYSFNSKLCEISGPLKQLSTSPLRLQLNFLLEKMTILQMVDLTDSCEPLIPKNTAEKLMTKRDDFHVEHFP